MKMPNAAPTRFARFFAISLFGVLLTPSALRAQVPVLPRIPDGLPEDIRQALESKRAPLQPRIDTLVKEGTDFNGRCQTVKVGSALERECAAQQQQWMAEDASLQKDVDALAARMEEIKQLVAQDQKLTRDIEGNLNRIRELGFSHRAEEFEEWENLSEDAKKAFYEKVKEQGIEVFADKVEDGILSGVGSFTETKAAKYIGMLEKIKPRPDEAIAVVKRLARPKTRQQLVEDSKFLVSFLKNGYGTVTCQTSEECLNVLMDVFCDVVPEAYSAQCKLFRAEAKAVSAEVYYGAATYVARQQVDLLTSLSEEQLKALAARNEVLTKHQIPDRTKVRRRIKALLAG